MTVNHNRNWQNTICGLNKIEISALRNKQCPFKTNHPTYLCVCLLIALEASVVLQTNKLSKLIRDSKANYYITPETTRTINQVETVYLIIPNVFGTRNIQLGSE